MVYEGIDWDFSKGAIPIKDIQGVIEAGWKPGENNEMVLPPSHDKLKDLSAKMNAVIKSVSKRKEAVPFLAPVNTKHVPDYLTVIQEPMDLQTMTYKLTNLEYKTLDMFRRDFELIISNCRTFNNPPNEFCELASVIEKEFERQMKTIFPGC